MLVVVVLSLLAAASMVAAEELPATIDCSHTCECKPTVKIEYSPGMDVCHNATYEWLLHTAVGQVTELNQKLEQEQVVKQRSEDEKRRLEESLGDMKKRMTQKTETINQLDAKLLQTTKDKDDQIIRLEESVKRCNDDYDWLENGKKKVTQNLEGRIQQHNAEIENLKQTRELLEGRVGRRDNTILDLKDNLKKKDDYIDRLEGEKADAEQRVTTLMEQLEEYQDQERRANLARDCADVQKQGARYSGLYMVYPAGMEQGVEVFCDLNTEGGGWTVFQRRQDGSVSFVQNWQQYKEGFGIPAREFWLGNDAIHKLTAQAEYELRVDFGDYKGVTYHAKYSKVSVGSEKDLYTVELGTFSGDAGDALAHHNGMPFSTYDNDNDQSRSGNCADLFGRGGWWYVRCYDCNLNGQYGTNNDKKGIVWYHLHKDWEALKHVEMKIRPIEFANRQ